MLKLSNKIWKVLLLVVVTTAIFVIKPNVHVDAGGPAVYDCDSITIQGASVDPDSGKNLVRIGVDDQGNPIPTQVTVTIQMSGISDFPNSAYQFSYVARSASGGGWNNVPLTLQQISPGVYRATTTITLNSTQDWLYSLEAGGGNGVYQTGSNGPGCGSGKTNEVILGVAPSDIQKDFRTRCSVVGGLSDQLNHFDCEKQPDGNYLVTGNNCATGSEPDIDRCRGGAGLTEPIYCMLCKGDTGQDPTRVEYGAKCDIDNNILCALDPGLNCNPSLLPGETGQSRCYYSGRYRKAGQSCFMKANECALTDPLDGSPLYCGASNPNNAVGVCTRLYDGIRCVDGASGQCARELGDPDATCVQGYCLPGYASDQDNPVTNPPPPPPDTPDPSTDFGSRNCPFAVACTAADLLRAYPGDSNAALRAGLLALCAGDTSRGIYFQDRSATAKPATEQYAEFVACSRCVRGVGANGEEVASGTWTEAFGCIITSPEGVFTALIRISLGVMGGVALLRITYLGIITAQSKDDGKIAEARKGVLATLGGIAIVVLSVLILRVLGVNIFDIVPPGFF